MKIIVEPNGFLFGARCCVCGTVFDLGDPQPVVYEDSGKRLGDVCSDCFDVAGDAASTSEAVESLSRRAFEDAESLRLQANESEKRAVWLRSQSLQIERLGISFAGIVGIASDPQRSNPG